MDPAHDPEAAAEAALLAGLRAGSDVAYEALVRSNSTRLLTVARRILGTEEDARDALQEAFISAFKALPRFEGHARLSTWLHRIVVNTALMKLRSRKRRPEEPIDTLLPGYKDDGHQTVEPVEWSDGADVALERAETRAFVRTQIDKLPDNYRTVLLLRDIEEMRTPEAADALGITENAVKIRLHRARQALRALIDQGPSPHVRAERGEDTVVTCRECNDFIMAYLDRELPPDVQAGFELHLTRCPACDCYLRQYKATVAAGRIACQDPNAPADVPEELINAILESRRRAQ